jgi:hypothetical protein
MSIDEALEIYWNFIMKELHQLPLNIPPELRQMFITNKPMILQMLRTEFQTNGIPPEIKAHKK